jgi:ABC-type Fe3+/spermidine/putrescine transport system ATPase subunit
LSSTETTSPNCRRTSATIGVVFQSYALFPHLTAQENVAFGLRMRQVARPERDRRAKNALAMVGLSGLEDRYRRSFLVAAAARGFGPRAGH